MTPYPSYVDLDILPPNVLLVTKLMLVNLAQIVEHFIMDPMTYQVIHNLYQINKIIYVCHK